MMAAGLGLVLAAEVGPVQCVLDGLCGLAADVEQPCDLGDGERDHAPMSSNHRECIHYC